MLVDYIDQHRDRFGVEPICAVLKDAVVQIAPSTYYAAKTRPPSARAVRDAELVVDIKTAHKANLGVYGVRKIHAELNREGVKVARCTVRSRRLTYCSCQMRSVSLLPNDLITRPVYNGRRH